MKAVNLLPPDLRSGGRGPAPAVSAGTEVAGGPGAFIVLGALAMCVIALAGYVLTSNTIKDRQAKLADVTAQSAAATQQAAALKPFADFESVANARVQTVNDLAKSRFDWEQALRDISRTLPADVTLSQLTGTLSSTATTAGAGGGGASTLRGAIDVPAIELQGCTMGQTDVAKLMSQIRDVDGVTRVSVAKSDKDTQTSRSVRQGGSQPIGTDVSACGTGDQKPTFDILAFFENDASAANDPAGLSTPGQPSTPASNVAAAAASASASPTPSPAAATSTTTSATGQSK